MLTVPSRMSLLFIGLVCALTAAALGISKLLGFSTVISWDLFQLLDREALAQSPLASLLLLHSQPPLLNATAAMCLQVAAVLGCAPETVAAALFLLLGLGTSVGLYLVTLRLTSSRPWALAAVVLLLLDPGYYFFAHTLFYPFPLQALMVALLWASARYLEQGKGIWLVVGVLVATVLTRSLFHPLWALSLLALLLLLRRRLTARPARARLRQALMPLGVLAALLCLWPLKNLLLFDRFTYSSWTGFNLSKTLPIRSKAFDDYMIWGEVSPDTRARLDSLASRYPGASRVVSAPRKTDGSRNWNHLVLLDVDRDLTAAGLAWRAQKPGKWLARAGFFYHCWALPTYFNPYELQSMLPGGRSVVLYESAYSAPFYADLRPQRAGGSKKPRVPVSLFGVLVFPLLLLAAGAMVLSDLRANKSSGAVLAVALWCTLWVLIVPCLTDGNEGNRMRFSVGPLMIVMACCALQTLWARLRARLSARGDQP